MLACFFVCIYTLTWLLHCTLVSVSISGLPPLVVAVNFSSRVTLFFEVLGKERDNFKIILIINPYWVCISIWEIYCNCVKDRRLVSLLTHNHRGLYNFYFNVIKIHKLIDSIVNMFLDLDWFGFTPIGFLRSLN